MEASHSNQIATACLVSSIQTHVGVKFQTKTDFLTHPIFLSSNGDLDLIWENII